MNIPRILAADGTGITLAFVQIGAVFMAADWWAVGAHASEYGQLVASIVYPLAVTLLLMWNLADAAVKRGYCRIWGLLAFLGLIGLVVVESLPDRTGHRGFPIELVREKR